MFDSVRYTKLGHPVRFLECIMFMFFRQAIRSRSGNLGAIIFRVVLVFGLRTLLFPAALATFALLASGSVEAAEPERIVVASGDSFEPLIFLNAYGEPDGVFAGQWELWSAKTGVEVELRLMEWSQAIPALLAGEVDAVDGVSYTPERAEFLNLSSPYSDMQAYIFFHESIGGVRRLSDLAGFPVGVIKGSHHEDHLLKEAPEVKPVTFANYKEMVHAAIKGHLQTFVGEEPIISFLFAKEGRRVTFRRTEAPFFASDLRVAVRKGETELLSLIERGQAAITDEERQRIWDEWTGESLVSLIPWRRLMLGACGVFVVVVLLVTWNAQLRRRIAKTTRTLRESEELSRASLNATTDMVYLVEPDGKILAVNDIAARNMGKAPDELIGTNSLEYFSPDVAKYRKEQADKVVRSGKPLRFQDKREGRFFDISIYPTFDTKGKVDRLAIFVADITERKQGENELRQAKEFIDNAINAQIDTFFVFNPNTGKAIRWNENFSRVSGYTNEEISMMKAPDSYYDEDDLEKANESLKELAATGSATVEISLITKKGKRIPFEYKVSLIEITGGENIAISIGRNITERKKAMETLRISEANYRSIFDSANDAIFVHDIENGKILSVNQKACEMFGYARKAFEKLTVGDLSFNAQPYDQEHVLQWIKKAVKEGPQLFEWICKHKTGQNFWAEINLKLAVIEGENRMLAILRDITERKQAEEKLKESEEKFRMLSESSSIGVFYTDKEGMVLYTNPAWQKITGFSLNESLDFKWANALYYEDKPKALADWADCLKKGKGYKGEFRFIDKKGKIKWVYTTTSPVKTRDGRIIGHVGSNQDITEHKRAEEEIERIFNMTGYMVCVADLEGSFIRVNSSFEQILGYSCEELLKRPYLDLIHPDDKDKTIAVLKEKLSSGIQVIGFENRYRCKDGSYKWLSWTSRPVVEEGVTYAIAHDITERKKARDEADRHQMEAAHAARLSSIGEMASALAHELNQPLCAILTHAEGCLAISRQDCADMEKLRSKLATVAKQAERAGAIISRIRGFARKGKAQKSAIDLNEVIGEVMSLIHAQVERAKILIELNLDEGVQSVPANRVQIEQVILNLVRNSVDAMQDAKPANRKLTITSSMIPENTVEVTIRDRGKGIDKKNAERIFQPFFTTKPEGLGLGLSISQSIVESHSGRLYVKENSDNGATFCLALPAIPEKA